MKGLLVKDFNFLLLQKKFLVLTAAICAVMLMTMEDPTFLIGYLTMMMGIITLSTINYDDFDRGNTFLFTLPITRKEYVLEKYVLTVVVSGIAWLVSDIACVLFSITKIEGYVIMDGIVSSVAIFAVCLLMICFMIPLQLKYGGEKSRVVLFTVLGIVVIAGYFLKLLSERLKGVVSVDVNGLLQTLSSIGVGGLTAIVLLVLCIVMLISILVSMRIMEKKEF